MRNIRILVGLTSLLATLAITATPASAWFSSGSTTSQGPYQLEAGTVVTFTSGGSALTCEEVTKGVWHIQTKFETGTTKIIQAPASTGPHQALSDQFAKCTVEVAGIKTPITVNPTCEQQLEQPTKSTGPQTITTGVISPCTLTVPLNGCIISIPAGKPNIGLNKVGVANITAGVKAEANVGGITSTVSKPCEEIGITGNKTNTLKAIGIMHNEKLV